MPCQQLPGNFEKDYHSGRVDVPDSPFGPKHGTRLYSDYPYELDGEGRLCAITIGRVSNHMVIPSFSFEQISA